MGRKWLKSCFKQEICYAVTFWEIKDLCFVVKVLLLDWRIDSLWISDNFVSRRYFTNEELDGIGWKFYFECEAQKNQVISYSNIYISTFYLFISKQFVTVICNIFKVTKISWKRKLAGQLNGENFYFECGLSSILRVSNNYMYIYVLLKNCYSINPDSDFLNNKTWRIKPVEDEIFRRIKNTKGERVENIECDFLNHK